jgi:hypothetical protein
VSGSNFAAGALVQWNGTALSTTAVSATELTAQIPASDLTSTGSAKVTVANPSPEGGTSSALSFTIAAAQSGATWVRNVAGIGTPQGIAWDHVRGRLYISNASSDTAAPNMVFNVDPVAGAVEAPISVGNNPDLLAISSDSSYLWVGLDGDHVIQRFLLPGFTKDISVPLPVDWAGNPQQAVGLEAAPVNPHTIAVDAGHWGYSPPGDGIYIYDDATQRPNFVPGFGPGGGPMIDWIQWGSDDTTIYGDQYTTMDAGGIAALQVTSAGVSFVSYNGGLQVQPAISQFDTSNGLLYSYGGAYDPVKATLVGEFNLPETGTEACTADSSVGRYYCFTAYSTDGVDITYFELWVFDLNTYAFLDRISFGTNGSSSVTGRMGSLVRWGNAGLALTTYSAPSYGSGGLFLIDGASVNPNGPPDSTSGTPGASLPQ